MSAMALGMSLSLVSNDTAPRYFPLDPIKYEQASDDTTVLNP
jgi:hypothetical protein